MVAQYIVMRMVLEICTGTERMAVLKAKMWW